MKQWRHTLTVQPLSPTGSRYTDVIELDAGVLSAPVWLYAHVFYRYRQARWRALVAGRTGR